MQCCPKTGEGERSDAMPGGVFARVFLFGKVAGILGILSNASLCRLRLL